MLFHLKVLFFSYHLPFLYFPLFYYQNDFQRKTLVYVACLFVYLLYFSAKIGLYFYTYIFLRLKNNKINLWGGGIFIDKNVAFLMKLMGQNRAMDHLFVSLSNGSFSSRKLWERRTDVL